MELFKRMSNSVIFGVYVFLLSLVFSSCSKLDEDKGGQPELSKGAILVNVQGIEDLPELNNLKLQSNVANSASVSHIGAKASLPSKLEIVGDFTFDISSEEVGIVTDQSIVNHTLPTSGKSKALGNNKAAIVNMTNTTTFWLLVYNSVTNACVFSKQLTASPSTTFDLPIGQTYRWYAYSYNDNVNITAPDDNSPVITTMTNKPFLYSSGVFSTAEDVSSNITITFKHKLTQLKVQLTAQDEYNTSNIDNLKAEFVGDYLKTSEFNIKTGKRVIQSTGVSVGDLVFSGTGTTKVASTYYTADSLLSEYKVQIKELSLGGVTYVKADFPNDGVATFSSYTDVVGKVLFGKLNLSRILPIRDILHYGPLNADGHEAWLSTSRSGAFIRNKENYGNLSNSIVKIKGLNHYSANNTVAGDLAQKIDQYKPHIVIASISTTTSTADFNRLKTFVDNGGRVIFMSNINTTTVQTFLRSIYNYSGLTLIYRDGGAGAVYKCVNFFTFYRPDQNNFPGTNVSYKDITPFGADPYGSYFGAHSSSGLLSSSFNWSYNNQPILITGYSVNFGVSRDNTYYPAQIANTYPTSFIHIGDGGFLVGAASNSSLTSYPFVTTSDNKVSSKPYGRASGTGELYDAAEAGKPAGYWQAKNSSIFANAFAFLLLQSTYRSGY